MTLLAVAEEAARAAGAVLAAYASGPTSVRHKGAVDLVTEVDLRCEAAIREVLARHTPEVPVLGEEGDVAVASATRWVVDPLDGTTNFVHGFPYYAVSVALEVDGRGEVGVVLDPVRHRLYAAARGQGATCDGARLRVSDTRDLGAALIGTGFPYDRREPGRAAFYTGFVTRVLERAQGVRRGGAAALDLAMVAAGALDGFWEFHLKPWDVAAGRLLITEAGGRYTAHDGAPLGTGPQSPLATNGWLHDALREALTAG